VIARLRRWAGALRIEVLALWLAARDPRVGLAAKCLAALVAAYALSPIDLIPDFIPVLGLLDDLLLVPLGIWLAVRLIDPAIMAELRRTASEQPRPRSVAGAAIVIALWLAGLALLGWWLRGQWA
jgi:uncharacterized membrane protein YkvA (DUF1232 family)